MHGGLSKILKETAEAAKHKYEDEFCQDFISDIPSKWDGSQDQTFFFFFFLFYKRKSLLQSNPESLNQGAKNRPK